MSRQGSNRISSSDLFPNLRRENKRASACNGMLMFPKADRLAIPSDSLLTELDGTHLRMTTALGDVADG